MATDIATAELGDQHRHLGELHAVDLQLTLGIGPTQRPGYTTAPLHATVKNRGPETALDAQVVLTLPETMLGRPVMGSTELSCTSRAAPSSAPSRAWPPAPSSTSR